jgi:hypothetical protein
MFRYDEYQLSIMTDAEKAKALSEEYRSSADFKDPARMKYLAALGLKRAEPQKRKRTWFPLSDPVKEKEKQARLQLEATYAKRAKIRKKALKPPKKDKDGNTIGGWTVRISCFMLESRVHVN